MLAPPRAAAPATAGNHKNRRFVADAVSAEAGRAYPCGAVAGNVTVTLAPSAIASGGFCRVALTRHVRV
jgi:hypothetical protein